jgi:hypothetical protein
LAYVQRAYRHSTRLFGALLVLLGTAMLVTAIARGGGPLSYGVVLGVLFAALGAARLYLSVPRMER